MSHRCCSAHRICSPANKGFPGRFGLGLCCKADALQDPFAGGDPTIQAEIAWMWHPPLRAFLPVNLTVGYCVWQLFWLWVEGLGYIQAAGCRSKAGMIAEPMPLPCRAPAETRFLWRIWHRAGLSCLPGSLPLVMTRGSWVRTRGLNNISFLPPLLLLLLLLLLHHGVFCTIPPDKPMGLLATTCAVPGSVFNW